MSRAGLTLGDERVATAEGIVPVADRVGRPAEVPLREANEVVAPDPFGRRTRFEQ